MPSNRHSSQHLAVKQPKRQVYVGRGKSIELEKDHQTKYYHDCVVNLSKTSTSTTSLDEDESTISLAEYL